MLNDEDTLPRTGVACALAALVAVSGVADAGELGVSVGSLDRYQSMALSYQTAPLWREEFAAHSLDVHLEYSLGQVRTSSVQRNHDLRRVGVTPFARWWFASNTGVELGVGANVFSGTHLGDKDISTAFQFGSSVGLLHRLQGTPWLLGLRLTHYSNASIKKPNPGQSYLQVRASYVLP